ncbi:hypothetical protein SAMN05660282_00054 [Corynebacterium spheniscorum]|uniref:Uncharacterized protein n=1 Tax=Corynebacterium spheniscorum TaxID=185761 RepID=A0A1I2PJ84_9CORY|nr:hypothetical protein SAMN05660282_00054 [Corynebacterium spheniscorum]
MRRLTSISVLTALAAAFTSVVGVPAYATTINQNPATEWRLVDESTFSGAILEGFEPMEVPDALVEESYIGIERPTDDFRATPSFHICSPIGHAENPHKSGSDVSAHGFWYRNNCRNFHANVRVDLSAFWGNRQTGVGTWITVAPNSQSIEAGGGRGNRVTARTHCYASSHPVSWRNTTDVDVIGERDWPGVQENIQTLYCAPTS